jgi:hypothetical protein
MNPWLFSGAIKKPEGDCRSNRTEVKYHADLCTSYIERKTAVFDQEIYGYPGACAGLGFGNGYYDVLGGEGVEFMSAFFVKDAESSKKQEAYCATVKRIPERERAKFLHCEPLHRNTDKAKQFMIAYLQITNILKSM